MENNERVSEGISKDTSTGVSERFFTKLLEKNYGDFSRESVKTLFEEFLKKRGGFSEKNLNQFLKESQKHSEIREGFFRRTQGGFSKGIRKRFSVRISEKKF